MFQEIILVERETQDPMLHDLIDLATAVQYLFMTHCSVPVVLLNSEVNTEFSNYEEISLKPLFRY